VTLQPAGDPGTCSAPLDPEVLMDYWLGLSLDTGDLDAIEEHLMSCDSCGTRLRRVIAVAEGLRQIAQSGAVKVIVTDALLRRAADVGRRVREYSLPAGSTVECTVSADDDLLVARLAADLSGAARVDLSFCDPNGVERQRMIDVPIDHDSGTLIYQESIVFAKTAPTSSMIARLLAVDDAGGERLLGQYRFNHTRTIPGPPGWEF
jgi:hypothetical protein